MDNNFLHVSLAILGESLIFADRLIVADSGIDFHLTAVRVFCLATNLQLLRVEIE